MRRFGLVFLTLLVSTACGSPTEPPATAEPLAALALSLDTLNVELQNLWVRIDATAEGAGDVTLRWELHATTANPRWSPKRLSRAGSKQFDGPGAAQVWGNVPRAYDFELIVTGVNEAGAQAVDTLVVEAPRCRDADRPGLICNVGARGGARVGR